MARKWMNTTSVDQHHEHISQLAFGTGHRPEVLIAQYLKSIWLNCRLFLFGHSLPGIWFLNAGSTPSGFSSHIAKILRAHVAELVRTVSTAAAAFRAVRRG